MTVDCLILFAEMFGERGKEIAIKVGMGLAYLHQQRICHLDLKYAPNAPTVSCP